MAGVKPIFRFSLRWLLIAVTLCAVGTAALLDSTSVWLTIVATASAVTLMIAVTFGLIAKGPARAFASGFAAWGLLYAAPVYLLWDKEMHESKVLATSQSLDFVLSHVNKIVTIQTAVGPTTTRSIDPDVFMIVGQLLWAWLFAIIGGILARLIYARYHSEPRP